jgi:DNA replication protein DnaC
LIYGETGTFKTTQLALIAEYLYERYGLKTRMVTAELLVAPTMNA